VYRTDRHVGRPQRRLFRHVQTLPNRNLSGTGPSVHSSQTPRTILPVGSGPGCSCFLLMLAMTWFNRCKCSFCSDSCCCCFCFYESVWSIYFFRMISVPTLLDSVRLLILDLACDCKLGMEHFAFGHERLTKTETCTTFMPLICPKSRLIKVEDSTNKRSSERSVH
jgi:hypothetical protein